MRVLFRLLVVLGAIVAGAWIGGEMLLARRAAALIAGDQQLAAAAVRELRDARRIGVRIEQLGVAGREGDIWLPWLDLWVPPRRPNEVHATLPAQARITFGGRTAMLTAEGGAVSARFAPAHSFALSEARVGAASVGLEGERIAERLALSARLVSFGWDAPRETGAAYDVTADIAGLSLAALTGRALTGTVEASGQARLWLDRAPARGGSATPPRLVGLRADGLEVRLGELGARIRGRVVAAADGRAEGELLIDTADAQGFVARAAELGVLPRATVPLAAAALRGLAGTGGRAAVAASASKVPASSTRPAGTGVPPPSPPSAAMPPPPREGELRIPIAFRDGRTWLGPLPVGPAPRFPG